MLIMISGGLPPALTKSADIYCCVILAALQPPTREACQIAGTRSTAAELEGFLLVIAVPCWFGMICPQK
jgi:hypothetical protein